RRELFRYRAVQRGARTTAASARDLSLVGHGRLVPRGLLAWRDSDWRLRGEIFSGHRHGQSPESEFLSRLVLHAAQQAAADSRAAPPAGQAARKSGGDAGPRAAFSLSDATLGRCLSRRRGRASVL